MKHKWHDEIVAWAGGAEIECFAEENPKAGWQEFDGNWGDLDGWEFRIKPQPKEPQYLYVYESLFDEKIVSLGKTQYAENNQIWKTIGKIPLMGVDDEQ